MKPKIRCKECGFELKCEDSDCVRCKFRYAFTGPANAPELPMTNQSSPDIENAIVFWYKNYKGEEGYRRAVPISIRYGTSDYHHSPQWLMLAFDTEKRAEREFAMSDMSHNCLGGEIKFALRARSSAAIDRTPAAVIRLLTKIANLVDDEDACEPLDDAIRYANEAIALINDPAQPSQEQK